MWMSEDKQTEERVALKVQKSAEHFTGMYRMFGITVHCDDHLLLF